MNHYREHHAGDKFSAGLIGLAFGAVLGMLLSPRSGKENRERAQSWMQKMSDDLNYQMKQTRDLTESRYHSMVDDLSHKYSKVQSIKQDELADFTRDLKNRWERIKQRWNQDNTPNNDITRSNNDDDYRI
jgi:gas vesicle protein